MIVPHDSGPINDETSPFQGEDLTPFSRSPELELRLSVDRWLTEYSATHPNPSNEIVDMVTNRLGGVLTEMGLEVSPETELRNRIDRALYKQLNKSDSVGSDISKALVGVTVPDVVFRLALDVLHLSNKASNSYHISALKGTSDSFARYALLDQMSHSENLFTRTYCADALADNSTLVEQNALLDAALRIENEPLPLSFTEKLIGTRWPEVIKRLIDGLITRTNSDKLRNGYARALRNTEDLAAQRALVSILEEEGDDAAKSSCAWSLRGCRSDEITKRLVAGLKMDRPDSHFFADALRPSSDGSAGFQHNLEVQSALLDCMLNSRNDLAKTASSHALCGTTAPRILAKVTQTLDDQCSPEKSSGDYYYCAHILNGTSDPAAQRSLVNALTIGNFREDCLRSLSRCKDPHIARVLLRELKKENRLSFLLPASDDMEVQYAYLSAIKSRKTPVELAKYCALRLQGSEHPQIVRDLIDGLGEVKRTPIKANYIVALGQQDNPEVIELLGRGIESERDFELRDAYLMAIEGTQNVRLQRSVVRAMASETEPNRLFSLARVLRGHLKPEIIEKLATLYRDSESPLIRAAVAESFGQCTEKQAEELLLEGLADEEPLVIITSARALARERGIFEIIFS